MAALTDIIAELAARIEDIEAAAVDKETQTIADLTSITERAGEVLAGIRHSSQGLPDPQATGEEDHAMGDSSRHMAGGTAEPAIPGDF